jgi:2-polyprenyl-6-methoxyphenol hydroxylase-like FAD-dependent oxidoreductase
MTHPSVLILGAGCFGLSTAYELLQRGYQNVTIVDRANELPAPDAASTGKYDGDSFSQKVLDRHLRTPLFRFPPTEAINQGTLC